MSKSNGKPAKKPKGEPAETIPPSEEPKAVVEEPKPAAAETKPSEPETAPKPTPPGKLTPEEIAAYDAETASLVTDLEADVSSSKAEWISAKEVASGAKKRYESDVDELRQTIRDRQAQRGKRPQKTLLDVVPKAKWRGLQVDSLDVPTKILDFLIANHTGDLGDLFAMVTSFDGAEGAPFGMTLDDAATVREAIQKLIDAEDKAAAPPEVPELWREYPIERWITHGLRSTDVARLHSGEIKGENKSQPIMTVGDLTNFMTPNKANPGWNRKWTDIKGIGPQAADRLDEANALFFRWWNADGEAEFKKEKGYASQPAAASKASDAGDEAGEDADGYDRGDSDGEVTDQHEPEAAAVA